MPRCQPAVTVWEARAHPCLERRTYLVSEGLSPDALTAFSRAGGVTGLDHEALYAAVPEAIVVVARGT